MSNRTETSTDEPFVPAQKSLPEITIRAIILGVVLAVILSAANAYLGLFAGMTVSASIPAAVVSMAILSLFRNSNILENNIVQTAASAGEGLATGLIFTLPALTIMGVWAGFNYWETTIIAGFGGVLGVLFTIPLRRALIVDNPLKYPEGVATAEVLKVGETGGAGVRMVLSAGIIGAMFKFGEAGLRLWQGAIEGAARLGSGLIYAGSNLSPALVGVGYILGLNVSILIAIGGALNWYLFIPIITAGQGGVPDGVAAVDFASSIWSAQTRFLGVGAMLVGGVWTLIKMRKSLISGIRSGLQAYRHLKGGGETLRTERDTPMQWVAIAIAASVIPLFFIFEHFTDNIGLSLFMAVIMIIAGFLFSSVGAYMAGLVGSSNNPISGVSIVTILTAAVLLFLWLGAGSPIGPAAAIFIGSVVASGVAIAGDNLQDLKAGRIVGATPYKQQIMQIVGVIAGALVMAPVLNLLLQAYGIGAPTAEHPEPLAAPQATLMASVANGVFGDGLPMNMVLFGMAIAAAIVGLDAILEKRNSTFRTPVLAVAVGLYLPLQLEIPIVIGGLIAWLVSRGRGNGEAGRNGILFAAGLITGEALVGIVMAVPIVIYGRSDVLAFWGVHNWNFIGVALFALVIYQILRVSRGK